MDPNRYLNEHQMPKEPVQNTTAVPDSRANASAHNDNNSPVRKKAMRKEKTGKLCVSAKRFFGQILIDHWVIRINGEQKELPFGQNKLVLELPAGVYLITAYTPYLGMHCMRVTADVEVRSGMATHISYNTVFDIFKDGILKYT